jgi:pimeloyl-ACP methyl ester carboxylesterase
MSGLSEELLAPANGIELAYQEAGDPDGEPLLLIMGLAMQMLGWDEDFCELLADRGFRVIRFDNRDVGRSTMLDHLGVASRFDVLRGRRSNAPYTLTDMGEDSFGLLDHLGIESAHVVGASMGGMIAQTMAIRRPDRVRSLVSMLSTTGNRWMGVPALRTWGLLIAAYPKVEEDYVARGIRTFRIIGSPGYPMDREFIVERAREMYARSHSPAGILRQTHAVGASGDRTSALRRLDLPATVLHGAADPLMRPVGARATADAIPGARLRIFEGMGHDLPRELWPDFVGEIAVTAARAGAPVEAVSAPVS